MRIMSINIIFRNNPISPLLVALRFYATGSFYITIGDFAKIHKSTAANFIYKVTAAIASLREMFVTFPSTDEEKM